MITDHEWNIISKKAFPKTTEKASPFLWTRILAAIETEENRRTSSWWTQWRWMMRLTLVVGLFTVTGSYYLFDHAAMPLDSALEGIFTQQSALTLVRNPDLGPDETPDLVVEVDS